LPLLLIALMSANASGQTPVVITVGGSNPDFQTITDALNAIPTNPFNPYVVNVRDGVYNEAVVLNVTGTSLVNTITLQSESQDSLAVTINLGNLGFGTVLEVGSHCILKHLSVIGNIESEQYTTDVKLLNTVISGDVTIERSENPVLTNNVVSGDLTIKRTDNCMVTDNVVSGDMTIWWTENTMLIDNVVSGNVGMFAADHSSIMGNQISGWLGLSSGEHSTVSANYVSGSLSVDGAPYSTVSSNHVGENLDISSGQNTLVTFNQVIGSTDVSRCPYSIVADNQISGDLEVSRSAHSTVRSNMASGEFESSRGDTSLFLNNVFGLYASISYSVGSTILNNRFNGGLRVLYSENGSVIGNEVIGETGFSYSENSFYIGNTFNGTTGFSYGTDGVITNNIFHGVTNVSFCDSTVLNFNNFSNADISSYLNFWGPVIVENNNLPLDVTGLMQFVSLHGNNYPSGISFNDPAPLFIDPLYDANLRSTNPQLTGTGQQNTLVMYDIDSVWRPNPPTVGANEICLSHDTVNVFCGDSIILGICTLPDSGDYVWSPMVGLDFDNVQRPRVSTTESRWYLVNDAVSGFIDSIYVNVVPLTPSMSSTFNDLLCGQQTGLVATYHAGATYSWHPSDGLSSTTSSSVVATPLDTTTYYVTVTVPGCESITDSASVRVNPLPIAYLYLDSSDHNFFRFLNASACADTYSWDFGDSTSSTDEHPEHFFPDSGGTFLITLIACNSFGCDTFQGTIYFEGIIDDIQSIEQPESFRVFPNPTTDDITISFTESDKDVEVRVFNGLGQCVYTARKKSAESVFLNLPTLPNGQYFLSIFDGELHRAQKLIISH
jgi:hypothetical protein